MNLFIIILAAGKGTRMGLTDKPKVMADLSGKPLIGHVIDAVIPLQPQSILPVIGFKKEIVEEYLAEKFPDIKAVYQTEQLGTGHAVMQTSERISMLDGYALILTGDTPLIATATLSELLLNAFSINPIPDAITVSTFLDEPKGYGRILRSSNGDFTGIVEEKDATDAERNIQEINTGMFLVKIKPLFEALQNISNENIQGEYYLTDIIGYLHTHGFVVSAIPALNSNEFLGINTLEELQAAERLFATIHKGI
ncbi:MAG: NTP transferase domain-containing protein [Candidatus Kapaibacteriota bacterium]